MKTIVDLFIGESPWFWRRFLALAGGFTMLAGILNASFWDRDLPHASMTMNACQDGFWVVMTIYVAGGVVDSHLRRRADQGGPGNGSGS